MRILLLDENQIVFKAQAGVLEAHETAEINIASQLEFVVANTSANWADLDRASYILVPIAKDTLNAWHMYSITDIRSADQTLTVTGIEEAYDDLGAYGYLKDHRMKRKKLAEIAGVILAGTRWTLGAVPDIYGDQSMYYISRLKALQDMVAGFGVEVNFVYILDADGFSIKERRVNVYTKMGTETGRRYVYGNNALTVEREQNRVGLYTAAVGRGKGEELTDGDDNPTGQYGRRIMFTDVVWSVANGDPVDKPAGQNWVEIPSATKQWGFPDGTPRTTILTLEDVTEPEQLLKDTYAALVDACRPQVQLSATIAKLGFEAHLGDSVVLVRHDLDLVYTARIFKLERDLLDENNTTVQLGDYLMESAADRLVGLQRAITNVDAHVYTQTRYMYEKLKGEAEDRLAEINAQAAALEKELADDRVHFDSQVNGLTQHVNDLNAKAEAGLSALDGEIAALDTKVDSNKTALSEDIADALHDANTTAAMNLELQLGKYADTVTAGFKAYNDGWQQKYTKVDGSISNLVQSIDGIQATVTNTTNNLQAKFTVLNNTVQAAISDDHLKSLFSVQLNAIQGMIEDTKGNLTSLTLLVNGIEGDVNDAVNGIKSQFIQLSDSVQAAISDDHIKTVLGATLDGIVASIEDKGKSITDLRLLVNGIQAGVTDQINGVKSQFTALSDKLLASVSDARLKSLLAVQLEGITAQINDVTGKYAGLAVTLKGIQGTVTNLQTNTQSKFSQLSDLIDARVTSADVKAQIDVSLKSIQAALTAADGKIASFGISLNGIQSTLNQTADGLSGLKSQVTQTANTWATNLTNTKTALQAEIASRVKNGIASIDLKAAGGYLSITGGTSTPSRVWLGGDNIYLTGDTHVEGDFFLKGINNQLQTLKMTADGLFVTDPNGDNVGHIHTNKLEHYPQFSGLEFDLDLDGDYMGWAAQDVAGGLYILKLVWYRKVVADRLNTTPGFTFDDFVKFGQAIYGQGAVNSASPHMNIQSYTINGPGWKDDTIAILNDRKTGFAMGNSGNLYLVIKNTATGLSGGKLPTSIRSDGTIAEYVTI